VTAKAKTITAVLAKRPAQFMNSAKQTPRPCQSLTLIASGTTRESASWQPTQDAEWIEFPRPDQNFSLSSSIQPINPAAIGSGSTAFAISSSPRPPARRASSVSPTDGTTAVLCHDRESPKPALDRLNDGFSAAPTLAGRELCWRGEYFLYVVAEEVEDRKAVNS
jgi:hypothetical protein